MAGNGLHGVKWLHIADTGWNGWKWLEMAEVAGKVKTLLRWLTMAGNGWEWLELLKVTGNYWKEQ